MGWGAAAFKCADRDRFIGWVPSEHFRRLRFIANNQRFLILPSTTRTPNLASRVLGLCLRRLSSDWIKIYNHPILLAETFVDPSRFTGTCYKAAGWICLGEARGFGRNGGVYYAHGRTKTIWVRPLHSRACAILAAPLDDPLLTGGSMSAIPFSSLDLEGKKRTLHPPQGDGEGSPKTPRDPAQLSLHSPSRPRRGPFWKALL